MDLVNNIVQSILYTPSLMDAHAQERTEAAKVDYQEQLSKILTGG